VLTDIPVTPTGSSILNEFLATHSNLKGTIAMAQSNGANTATNQFFFNTTNNTTLDSQKFTVFGKITDPASLTALTTLAGTTTKDLSTVPGSNPAQTTSFASAHPTALVNNFPLTNYTGNVTNFPTDASIDNYMRITDITVDKRTEFLSYSLVGANGG